VRQEQAYDPFWEAFRKVNRLKLQLTTLAHAGDNDDIWQLIVLVNEIEAHMYEALRLRSTRAASGKE